MNMEQWQYDTDRQNRSTGRETSPSGALSTDLTLTGLGWNLGLRGERPQRDRLSHGTAVVACNGLRHILVGTFYGP